MYGSSFDPEDMQLFAILGVAGFFGGMFRLCVSMVAVLFEFTLTEVLLPYLIIVIMIAKGIGDRLCDDHFT